MTTHSDNEKAHCLAVGTTKLGGRLNLPKTTWSAAICLTLFAFIMLLPQDTAAQSSTRGTPAFRSAITRLAGSLVNDNSRGKRTYVNQLYDTSPQRAYYPFMSEVRSSLETSLINAGLPVHKGITGIDAYVSTSFGVSNKGLALSSKLVDIVSGALLAGGSVEIPTHALPDNWSERGPEAVARELAEKLSEGTLGQRIELFVGEITGGREQDQGLISDFSSSLRERIGGELGKMPFYSVVVASTGGNVSAGACELNGKFVVTTDKMSVHLSLLGGQKRTQQKASVSSSLPLSELPLDVKVLPDNAATAQASVDWETDQDAYTPDVNVRVWTERDKRVFHDGDPLRVYLKAAQDCYARVYYIQSDGFVWQIFPSTPTESARLRRNETVCLGCSDDDVELTITEQTLGQEFIKVFASTREIDDSALPRGYVQGVGYQVEKGYDGLKQGIRIKGLNVKKKKVLPVAELKLLVERQRQN